MSELILPFLQIALSDVWRISSWTISSTLHHLPDQPGSVVVFVAYGPNPDFQPILSSLRSGNEVFNFVSKTSDDIGRVD